jgi:phage replication-related protein YjqB (UPF0714/DUF867 family)
MERLSSEKRSGVYLVYGNISIRLSPTTNSRVACLSNHGGTISEGLASIRRVLNDAA